MREVAVGGTTTLTGNLITFADNLPAVSGTIKAVLLLISDDSDNLKMWDTNAGDWSAESVFDTTGTHPAATYVGQTGAWYVSITAAMTSKPGSIILLQDLTDDPSGAATTTQAGSLDSIHVGSQHEHRA